VQRSGTSVVLAATRTAVEGIRVPCSRVELEWTAPSLRRLLQSRMDRCAERPIAAPTLDALFDPAIPSAEVDAWLVRWGTPRAALDAMAALVRRQAETDGPTNAVPSPPARRILDDDGPEPEDRAARNRRATPIHRATIERVMGRQRPD
jgi:hypothetical protein